MRFLDYIEETSKLKVKEENKDLSIAVLRSYTCENIEPILKTELYRENFNVNVEFGMFNQYYQEAIDKDSFLYRKHFDIVLLLIRPSDLFAGIYDLEKKEELEDEIKISTCKVKNIIENIIENSNVKSIIMINMEEYENEVEGILEYNDDTSTTTNLKMFNYNLVQLKKEYSIFNLIDINKIISDLGKKSTYNPKMKYLSRDPYKIDFYIELVKYIKRIVRIVFYPAKKVLLLDLDNTLYKGIIGEDDADKIVNFSEYPGLHYNNLQIKIKNLKNKGILLGIVSKNNLSDVENLFKLNKMPLKLDDFIAVRANWEDKYLNIIQISEELNLDLNSFVFIDDNPYEIELINKKLPQVETINISLKPEEAEHVLDEVYFFDKLNVTKEDKRRTEMYRNNIKLNKSESIDDFLAELNMEVEFKKLIREDKDLIERASQMTMKTNQFNMTTKRYDISEIESIIKNEENQIIMMFVKDKYGDNGSVGLMILKKNEIDTFLLSCRVLKRNLEYCMLDFAKNSIEESELLAEYIETNRNKAFSDFYKNAGMQEFSASKYRISTKIKGVPDYIKII